MPGRILVIRGGAIGDFILTLPALGLLRGNFPDAHIEILGYKHICSLADRRYYADAVHSIEYGPLAGFFNPKAKQDAELVEYFASFHQVISYLFDPDELFETCLRQAGVKNLITASPKIAEGQHAIVQLSRPLEGLALFLDEAAARFHPSSEDLKAADEILQGHSRPLVALHPGSGGELKNWPLDRWLALIRNLEADQRVGHIFVVGGESDTQRLSAVRNLASPRTTVLESLPLCTLGAVFSRCHLFIGHDSGISHLAGAADTDCLLLFGPTDPDVWAPTNPGVLVLRSPEGNLEKLDFTEVEKAVGNLLDSIAV